MVQLLQYSFTLKIDECTFDTVEIINRSVRKKLYKFFFKLTKFVFKNIIYFNEI